MRITVKKNVAIMLLALVAAVCTSAVAVRSCQEEQRRAEWWKQQRELDIEIEQSRYDFNH